MPDRQLLHEIRALLDQLEGEQHAHTQPTVSQVWALYLDRHVLRYLGKDEQATIQYSWKNLAPHFAELDLGSLTSQAFREYEDRRRRGELGRPAKARTIMREFAYLHAAIVFAGDEGMTSIRVPKYDRPVAGPPKRSALKWAEVEALLVTEAGRRKRDGRLTKLERFMWIALFTGARKTAILHLRWDHVDFDVGVIDFRDPAKEHGRKRRAVVPMASSLAPVLQRAYEERLGDLVLDNAYDGVWGSLQVLAFHAGLGGTHTAKGRCPKGTGLSPHSFRHTAASLMARSGVPLFTIAGVLGNSVAVVEEVYAEHIVPRPAESVDHIGQLLLPD